MRIDMVSFLALAGIIGIVVGVYLAALSMTMQKDLYQEAVEAIAECEKELPRNQHCEVVITAKAKDGDV